MWWNAQAKRAAVSDTAIHDSYGAIVLLNPVLRSYTFKDELTILYLQSSDPQHQPLLTDIVDSNAQNILYSSMHSKFLQSLSMLFTIA